MQMLEGMPVWGDPLPEAVSQMQEAMKHEAVIDQRFVEMNYLYEPPPETAERWEDRLRRLVKDLQESQRKFNNAD